VLHATEQAGTRSFQWRGRSVDPSVEAEWLTVADAFQRYAGVDLRATLDFAGNADRDGLARQSQLRIAADESWSDIFSRVLVEKIEPHLGLDRPTILCEYPAAEAALARPKSENGRVAERFELYVCGVEIANGFGELTDPVEQRRRFRLEMDEKERVYGERYPLDGDFLAALAAMPPASGVALGLDRLVMLATGAPHIDLVQWTPAPPAGGETSDE